MGLGSNLLSGVSVVFLLYAFGQLAALSFRVYFLISEETRALEISKQSWVPIVSPCTLYVLENQDYPITH